MTENQPIEQWRKKPVVIQAVQYTGENDGDIMNFAGVSCSGHRPDGLHLTTLEGELHVSKGDFVIKGVKGEFYPCKPDIFESTYEPASQPSPPTGKPLRAEVMEAIEWVQEVVRIENWNHPLLREKINFVYSEILRLSSADREQPVLPEQNDRREPLRGMVVAKLKAERDSLQRELDGLKEPMSCRHLKANLQPTDGPADACIVCAEIQHLKDERQELQREKAELRAAVDELRQGLDWCINTAYNDKEGTFEKDVLEKLREMRAEVPSLSTLLKPYVDCIEELLKDHKKFCITDDCTMVKRARSLLAAHRKTEAKEK